MVQNAEPTFPVQDTQSFNLAEPLAIADVVMSQTVATFFIAEWALDI